jgi:hypothetical protein
VAGAGVATLQNTLVDGNFRGAGSTASDASGAITANYSLFGNTSGATVSGANNQLNVSGRLAALADNGSPQIGSAGSTAVLQTHALLAGSPALDTGSNGLVPGTITTDQRGASFARIRDAGDVDTIAQVDIGAYEAHPSVGDIAAQVMNEDGVLMLTIHYGDAANASGGSFDAVTAPSGPASTEQRLKHFFNRFRRDAHVDAYSLRESLRRCDNHADRQRHSRWDVANDDRHIRADCESRRRSTFGDQCRNECEHTNR